MKRLGIQAGHWNTVNGQTGAPRELERTLAIGRKLVELLNANGFYAVLCDALSNTNPTITGQDWDLFLSLHCDMDYAGVEGGGFIDFPDPSVDSVNTESKRIKEAIESVYFKDSGIRNVPSRSNANTKFYYMWSALSSKTPCVILEMGESVDPHDSVILNDTERQAKIILSGIRKAFPDNVVVDPCQVFRDDISFKDKIIGERDLEIVQLKEKISTFQDQVNKDAALKNNTRSIIYGRGWVWVRMNQLKVLYPKPQ